MSTVLWANQLLDGVVTSDESDKYALYKHSKKLTQLSQTAAIPAFSELLDFTDMQFNLGDDELPEGMQSTNELVAENGVWKDGAQAVEMLEALLKVITTEKPRFGLVSNDYDAVVTELQESIAWARKAAEMGARFNFSVVG
jgi:hypothetical protein